MYGFLCGIVRDQLGVYERKPAFRAFRLRGSNEVYAYEEKHSRARVICKFYGPRFGWDRDRAARAAYREFDTTAGSARLQPGGLTASRGAAARRGPGTQQCACHRVLHR